MMRKLYIIPILTYAALYAFIYKVAFMSLYDTTVIFGAVLIASSIFALVILSARKAPDKPDGSLLDTNVSQDSMPAYKVPHMKPVPEHNTDTIETGDLTYETSIDFNGRKHI